VTWLAAWAPRGNTELIGVCAGVSRIEDVTDDHIAGLAAGLARGLRAYGRLGYSTFNFAVYSGPSDEPDGAFSVYASLVSRQSYVENYRCDDYFLQKMLGTEVVVDSPEQVAALARDAGE
jgi:galactose-1-phosphate uridylyltransferase